METHKTIVTSEGKQDYSMTPLDCYNYAVATGSEFSYNGARQQQYKDHKKHGKGTYAYANGDKYVGEWKKAKYDGKGIYTYANGDQYAGEWKKGLRHGKGIFTNAKGKIEEGIWKKDKLVKPK